MKRIMLDRHGAPGPRTCSVVEVDEPGAPGPGQIVVAIEAAAINPADILIVEGRYPGPDILPAPIGIEGAGRVIAVGKGVDDLAVGDSVMSLGRQNWAERIKIERTHAIKLPPALDLRDAAQIKANPPSAMLMLRKYVDLKPGDWVIQNAANSAVGRHLIRLARMQGVKTINVIRRGGLEDELRSHGGDLVLVDGEDLGARVRAAVGDEPVRLAVDAVGGAATRHLADCLSDGGMVVNYGFLSGEPCEITPTHLIVHGLALAGFWLVKDMGAMSAKEREALFGEIAGYFIDGTLSVPVEAEYSFAKGLDALVHAARGQRHGKILLRGTGA